MEILKFKSLGEIIDYSYKALIEEYGYENVVDELKQEYQSFIDTEVYDTPIIKCTNMDEMVHKIRGYEHLQTLLLIFLENSDVIKVV